MPIVPTKWRKSYSSKKAAAKKADELQSLSTDGSAAPASQQQMRADASATSGPAAGAAVAPTSPAVDMVTCPGYTVQDDYEATLNGSAGCSWSLPSRYIRYVPPKNAVREWWQPMASADQVGTDAAADEEEWVFDCVCGEDFCFPSSVERVPSRTELARDLPAIAEFFDVVAHRIIAPCCAAAGGRSQNFVGR